MNEDRRVETIWRSYDMLIDEYETFLRWAYQMGFNDGKNGIKRKPPTRDEIKRKINALR